MDMQNYTTPFAIDGDREEFSIDTDPSGKVSLKKGWTELYQLRPEEGGLFILRKVFNQMMKLVSTDTVTWKTQTFPNWIDDKGDGTPFAYPKNAIVKYTNGDTYVSLANNNTQVPTGANWKLFDITSLDNTVKLTGDQTIAGVKTFSSSPIVPTPATGTQAVNKDYADLKVALSQFTGTNQSLNSNGYQKLPGGLIIQWGLSPESISSGETTCYFPIAFPTALTILTHSVAGVPHSRISTIINQRSYSFDFSVRDSATGNRIDGQTIYFFAVGY